MSKLTKNQRIDRLVACLRTQGVKMRELEVKLEALEEWSNGADDMLTELNHALPDPEYDAKCEENAVAVQESLDRHAVRLGLVKPKPKQLDQSVFDGLDEKWRFAVRYDTGLVRVFCTKPIMLEFDNFWRFDGGFIEIGYGYEKTDWQNSLIERDKVELTGSDLCRAMRSRGDQFVQCIMNNDEDCINLDSSMWPKVVVHHTEDRFKCSDGTYWNHAIPINNQGEPLTADDVGL